MPALPASALLLVLLLAACIDRVIEPIPPAPAEVVISFGVAPSAGEVDTRAAYDQADQVRIRLTREAAPDLIRELEKPVGAEARLSLSVEMTEAEEPAQLTLELLYNGAPLFRGGAEVVLVAGETTEAPLTLQPVPARVELRKPLSPIESLGETTQLVGAVVFATGQAIPGLALTWQALDPGVVEVGPHGLLVARAEGEARVEGRYEGLADTVRVQVRPVVASVEVQSATSTLQVGQTLQLGAVLRDGRGNPLASHDEQGNSISGRALSWTSSRLTSAQVDAQSGLVTATAPDTVTITATTSEGISGSVSLTLIAASTPEPPQAPAPMHGFVDDFAGRVIDLEKWIYYDDPARTRQDDRLIVTLTPGVAGYGGLLYRLPHSLAGSFFHGEISQTAAGGPHTETFVGVTSLDEEEYVVITSLGGKLSAWRKWRGQPYARVGSELNFHPTNHRFRRIREHGGTIFFEVSANGTTWTRPSGWSIAHSFTDLAILHGIVGAGAYTPDPNAGTAIFENVNTTIPAIPHGLAASLATGARIELSWQDRSVNETGFHLERRSGEGAFEQIATLGANVTQHADSSVQPGTAYEYRVRAYNATGNSSYSNAVSVAVPPLAAEAPASHFRLAFAVRGADPEAFSPRRHRLQAYSPRPPGAPTATWRTTRPISLALLSPMPTNGSISRTAPVRSVPPGWMSGCQPPSARIPAGRFASPSPNA